LTEHSPHLSSHRPDAQHPDKAEFAKRLRAAIERKGWTLSETARQTSDLLGSDAKFGRAHVWHYLNGRAIPRARHLDALSQALQVKPHELLGSSAPSGAQAEPDLPGVGGQPSEGGTAPYSGPLAIVHAEDYGDGTAFLQISQRVPWPIALKVMTLLKAPYREGEE
jgi:transcriptional regulator with XRE-family HTH domain